MTGVGQQSRMLLHHKRHPKPRHGGQGIGGESQSWWLEGVIVQGKDKGAHADKGKGKGWEYHLALGPPTRDATRATKASMQARASLLKARAGVYFLAMQTRASPWRARAGVYIMPREIVKCEILGPFGMDSLEVIQSIHTTKGFQKMMGTPLWKGGNVSRTGRTMLFRNLAHSKSTSTRKAWSVGTCT